MTHKIEEAKNTILKQFRKLQDSPGPSLKLYQWQRMAGKERLSSVDRNLHAAQGSLGYLLPGVITQGVPHFSVRQLPLGHPSSHGGKKPIQLTLAHHLDTIVSLVYHSSPSWWEVCSRLPIFSWNL